MSAPYTDKMDCFSIRAGQRKAFDQNVLLLHGMRNHTDYVMDDISQSWLCEAGDAREVCNSNDKCTLTYRFKRSFETDSDKPSDSPSSHQDVQIKTDFAKHYDAYSFIRTIKGDGSSDEDYHRSLSEPISIWLRAAGVTEEEKTLESNASWSVFYILGACIILYYTIKCCKRSLYNQAVGKLDSNDNIIGNQSKLEDGVQMGV